MDPEKTFEHTVDSLRDFIIALDKEKADRLRYRVEDDVVRIFITPYHATITQDDLRFTHGDFNVELVLALGVENKDELDAAIQAHGRILHDATVATVNAQNKKSSLGSIEWQDINASSLSEMLVSVAESLQAGLDEQIATSLLTGIVAATDRFSNTKTSPKSMTMAAQLMAAGANQQLIASKLEATSEITAQDQASPEENDGSTKLQEGKSKKLRNEKNRKNNDKQSKGRSDQGSNKKDDGNTGQMIIEHATPAEVHEAANAATHPEGDEQQGSQEVPPVSKEKPFIASASIEKHDQNNKKRAGEEALDAALAQLGTDNGSLSEDAIASELAAATPETKDPEGMISSKASGNTLRSDGLQEPSLGGALSATTQEAEEAKRREAESARNKVIMSHGGSPESTRPPEGKTLQPLSSPVASAEPTLVSPQQGLPAPTLEYIETELHNNQSPAAADNARGEIDNIYEESPQPTINPAVAPPQHPGSDALPPPPPLPDFASLPPLPPNATIPAASLDANGLPFSPIAQAPQPPASEGEITPPIPSIPSVEAVPAPFVQPPAPAPVDNGPGQFRIPGQ